MTKYSKLAASGSYELFVLKCKDERGSYLAKQTYDNIESGCLLVDCVLEAEWWWNEEDIYESSLILPDGMSLSDFYIRRVELEVSQFNAV